MSEQDLDFGELRSFLHSESPNTVTRRRLFERLSALYRQDTARYQSEYVPYLQDFEAWWGEPLVWTTLDPWSREPQVRGYVDLSRYRRVMPFGPYKLEVLSLKALMWSNRSLRDTLLESLREEGAALERCVGLGCNQVQMHWEDGNQCGTYEADSDDLVESLLETLSELEHLRHFKFVAPRAYTSYTTHGDGSESTEHWEPSIQATRRDQLFKTLRASSELEHVELSHSFTAKNFYRFHGKNWSALRSLNIQNNLFGNTARDRDWVTLFPETMEHLKILSLQGCHHVDAASMERLLDHTTFPALESINIKWTSVEAFQDSWRERLPALREIIIESS